MGKRTRDTLGLDSSTVQGLLRALAQSSGGADDAVRFALSANFHHGQRPTKEDAKKAYAIAKRRGLLDTRSDGIAERAAALLDCSIAWAYELAKADIAALQAEKQAKVFKAKAQGKSNRQAAKAAGVDEGSVRNWTKGAEKLKGAKIPHPAEPAWSPADIPREVDAADEGAADDEQAELFEALAAAKEAEAEILRDEDRPLDPEIIARLNAEAPARHAHGALVRALEAVLALEPPEALIAYYRKMVIRRRTRPATP